MPMYSIEIDENKYNFGQHLPETLPVFHHGRKIGLAVLEKKKYWMNLPHSLSYLIHIDHAELKIVYSGNGSLADNKAGEGWPEGIELAERERVIPPPTRIKLRPLHLREHA